MYFRHPLISKQAYPAPHPPPPPHWVLHLFLEREGFRKFDLFLEVLDVLHMGKDKLVMLEIDCDVCNIFCFVDYTSSVHWVLL